MPRPTRRRVLALAGGVASGGVLGVARVRSRAHVDADARRSGWVLTPGPFDEYDVLFDGLSFGDGDGPAHGVLAGSVGGDIGEDGWLVGIHADGRVAWNRRYRLLSGLHRLARLPDGDFVGLGWGPRLTRFSRSVPAGEPPVVTWTEGLSPPAHGRLGLTTLGDSVVAVWEHRDASGTTLHLAGVEADSGSVRWRRDFGDSDGDGDGDDGDTSNAELGGVVPADDGGVAVVTGNGVVSEFAADGTPRQSASVGGRVDDVRRIGDAYLVAAGGDGAVTLSRFDGSWASTGGQTYEFGHDDPFVVTDVAPTAGGTVGVAGFRRRSVPVPTVAVLPSSGSARHVVFETPPGERSPPSEHYVYALVPLGSQFVAVGAAGNLSERSAWVAPVGLSGPDTLTPRDADTDAASPTDVSPGSRVTSRPETATRTRGRSPSPVWTTERVGTEADSPGFGVVSALVTVGLAALFRRRSRRR